MILLLLVDIIYSMIHGYSGDFSPYMNKKFYQTILSSVPVEFTKLFHYRMNQFLDLIANLTKPTM